MNARRTATVTIDDDRTFQFATVAPDMGQVAAVTCVELNRSGKVMTNHSGGMIRPSDGAWTMASAMRVALAIFGQAMEQREAAEGSAVAAEFARAISYVLGM